VYGKESSKVASTTYDARPEQLSVKTFEEIHHLQQSLEAMQTPVALLHVLPLPSQRAMNSPAADNDTGNVQVNHSDPALPHIPRSAQFRVQTALKREPQPVSLAALHKHMMDFMKMIMYCQEDCQRIEVATRHQSKCVRWHEERHCRVTSSNFSSLCKSITTCKVKSLLYSDNKSTLSISAILWGRLHEKSAFDQYQSTLYLKIHHCVNLEYIFPSMVLLLHLLMGSLKPMVKYEVLLKSNALTPVVPCHQSVKHAVLSLFAVKLSMRKFS
jgi:hypothetical protein